MIYNVANTSQIGRPTKRIFDANGTDYPFCVEVDTETGRIVTLKREGDSFSVVGGEVVKEIHQAQPPITVLFQ